MPDVWATITEASPTTVEQLAGVLERRAADPQQQAITRGVLSDVEFQPGARVLEIGCGTGSWTRLLANWPGVGEAVGVDPSPGLLAKAREFGAGVANLTFEQADGRALPFAEAAFDIVLFHSTLSHIPDPAAPLSEAGRVLRPGGWLAVCDGDYATTTLAVGDYDPLQACAEAMLAASVTDRWLVRRLPALVRAAGFEVARVRSYGYVETTEPGYMLTIVDRGADLLAAQGRIGPDLATALKAEARRRAAAGGFFGHIAYGSLVARKSI